MIEAIVSKFKSFRNRLFHLFPYRAGATLDLIDAVCAEASAGSVVKLSLSTLFRRAYSSLTDVLSSLFRTNLKWPATSEERSKQTLKMTQLLAEECASPPQERGCSLFAIDCTANPRIYANKVADRTIVHAPHHVPGQKPITVGHEYSVLVHLPQEVTDRQMHWVVPLSVKRVESHRSGPQVGLEQLEEIAGKTVFKDHFCINVSDAAYSTRGWVIGVSQWPHLVHIARMRSNRKVYRMPPSGSRTRRGRPLLYGEEILLGDPPQPDLEEITTTTTRRGEVHSVLLQRWNDVILQGSKDERTHEHPFDLLRVQVTDKKGKAVYRRPLWGMIAGAKRREVTSKEAYTSYGRRYDIEHFFRFGKQKLGLISCQSCETRHEENWHWIGMLAYNMLYHARQLTQAVRYPWEERKVHAIGTAQKPSQVQRDYGRIIREIGTPAPIPKPRGKSPGREIGCKRGERRDQPLIRKSNFRKDLEDTDNRGSRKTSRASSAKRPRERYRRMQRIWTRNRPPPMRC